MKKSNNASCHLCGKSLYRCPRQLKKHKPTCAGCMGRATPIKYTRELLVPIVAESCSMSDVARKLGLRPHGNLNNHLKTRMKKLGVDFSHFVQPIRRSFWKIRTPEDTLILRPEGSRREHAHILRRILKEVGVLYQCAECGQQPVWNGQKLVLQIDHLNGKIYDDRRENLRFLCPNCHTQTKTFGSKNQGDKAAYYEPISL